ncbi:MAG: 4Fe-4S binding protein [Bacteroidetes bacterium]|nr:MAG: 4Fe-4S binding protein [Bacteroidota bacterium]
MTSGLQKLALTVSGIGIVMVLVAGMARKALATVPVLWTALGLITIGVVLFIRSEYSRQPAGIRNNGVWFRSLSARGIWAWLVAVVLTGFYTALYFGPEKWFAGLTELFSPLSQMLRGRAADKWFVYGGLYTFSVLVMGLKFGFKYRHNRYQVLRTVSVSFFQLGFAFLVPAFMQLMNQPEFYFSYFWPLKDWYGTPSAVQYFSKFGIGPFLLLFGALMTFVATPVLTYFFGKRWYCSWVCGCGGLAETAGDPFRHLSDKSLKAWRLERWMIHSVLVAVVLMTALLWLNSWQKGGILGDFSRSFAQWYGYLIGMAFSGVVGVGFYPLMGSRVWCRFGCPQAAILGLLQKKRSKFRITVNGSQCISCGNCSTYCEMGIDVRHYAQRGQDVVRASCVGCGICAAVCPRGVLRLEGAGLDAGQRAEYLRNTKEPA